jgi:hypothetical protein
MFKPNILKEQQQQICFHQLKDKFIFSSLLTLPVVRKNFELFYNRTVRRENKNLYR